MRTQFRGFTLIELLITALVAAIVLTYAIPSFRDMLRRNEVVAHTNDLTADLNAARTEAVKRGSRVAICASDDGSTCAGDNDWASGWLVFVDSSEGDDGPEMAEKLLVRSKTPQYMIMTGPESVQYTPRGAVTTTPEVPFSINDAGCADDRARQIQINAAGLARFTYSDC